MVFTSILEGPEWEHEAEVRPWERGNGIREEKVAEVGEEDEEEAEKLPVRLWAKRGGLQLLWQLQTSQYYSLGRSYPPNGPHVTSPGAARIGASKNPSLFELNALCAVSPVQYRSGMNVYWFHVILWCEENFISETCIKNYFSEEILHFIFLYVCIKEFFII